MISTDSSRQALKARKVTRLKQKQKQKHGLSLLFVGVLSLFVGVLLTSHFSALSILSQNPTSGANNPKCLSLNDFAIRNVNSTEINQHKIGTEGEEQHNPGGKQSEDPDTRYQDKAVEKLPSAKLLLDMKPPFKDSDIITLYPADAESKQKPLVQSENTIVTGYFRVRSKHHPDDYNRWMEIMLSLQDAMVIFTEEGMVDQMKKMRRHAINRTVIVPISLDDLPIGKLFPESFWIDQLERDPEKKIHRSHQLFWIWLSKLWFVMQAIRMNLFESDVFVWSDIGCFRRSRYSYRFKTLVEHREVIPRHEILQMAHREPNPPSEELYNDKHGHKENFYHSGSQFVGYKDTLSTFHQYFLETIDRFLEKKMIIVDDQAVLQSTCLSHPEICAYAPGAAVKDNHYFGLRHILHFGEKIDYWRGSPK